LRYRRQEIGGNRHEQDVWKPAFAAEAPPPLFSLSFPSWTSPARVRSPALSTPMTYTPSGSLIPTALSFHELPRTRHRRDDPVRSSGRRSRRECNRTPDGTRRTLRL